MGQIEEKQLASKLLVDFLTSYTSLIEQQLNGIRERMTATVESIMDGISRINTTADEKRKMADAILVKRSQSISTGKTFQGDDADFRNASAAELGWTADKAASSLEARSTAAKERFTTHMNSLQSVDDEVRDILFAMMGALSADDVVGQRLEHVRLAITGLRSELGAVIVDFPSQFNVRGVKTLEKVLLTNMYRQYTMEEEKDVFREVFPERNKAS
jgi:hypothetical protein